MRSVAEEPVYLAQTAEPLSVDRRHQWIRGCIDEGRRLGATFFRASVHDSIADLTLVEGWEKQPKDQGPLRWQLVPHV